MSVPSPDAPRSELAQWAGGLPLLRVAPERTVTVRGRVVPAQADAERMADAVYGVVVAAPSNLSGVERAVELLASDGGAEWRPSAEALLAWLDYSDSWGAERQAQVLARFAAAAQDVAEGVRDAAAVSSGVGLVLLVLVLGLVSVRR